MTKLSFSKKIVSSLFALSCSTFFAVNVHAMTLMTEKTLINAIENAEMTTGLNVLEAKTEFSKDRAEWFIGVLLTETNGNELMVWYDKSGSQIDERPTFTTSLRAKQNSKYSSARAQKIIFTPVEMLGKVISLTSGIPYEIEFEQENNSGALEYEIEYIDIDGESEDLELKALKSTN